MFKSVIASSLPLLSGVLIDLTLPYLSHTTYLLSREQIFLMLMAPRWMDGFYSYLGCYLDGGTRMHIFDGMVHGT